MNRYIKILSLILAISCMLSMAIYADNPLNELPPEDRALFDSSGFSEADHALLRGIMVRSDFNQDYPNQTGSTGAELYSQADQIARFAKDYGYNTLFYEVSPRADAMYRSAFLPTSRYMALSEGNFTFTDPLKVLIKKAQSQKLGFYAVLSPLYAGETGEQYSKKSPVSQHPDWFITKEDKLYFDPNHSAVREYWSEITKELSDKYHMDGIMFSFSEIAEAPEYWDAILQMLTQCIEAAKENSPQLFVGVSMPHTIIDSEEGRQLIRFMSEVVDFIVPMMDVSISSKKSYQDYLMQWDKALPKDTAALITQNMTRKLQAPLTEELIFGDKREMNYQLFANRLYGGGGFILDSYEDVLPYASLIAQDMDVLPDFKVSAERASSKKITFAASEPIVFTSLREYCITGRCDPTLPLLMNDKPVEHVSEDGYFSVCVPLERGANAFRFRQGDQSEKLTIYFSKKNMATPFDIQDIIPKSVYPRKDEILFEGSSLELSCTAPYGGSVSARFQGNTYQLTPEEELSEDEIGRPVKYSIEISPEISDHTLTKNLGKVSYILSYRDFTSKYRSEGEVYLVGSSSRLAVKVDNSFGRVYHTPSKYTAIGNLLNGASDFALLTNNNFFQLRSGGYIHKSDVSVVEGFVDIEKSLKTVAIQPNDRGENLVFFGMEGIPYHVSFAKQSGVLTLKLYNLSDMPKTLSHLSSKLFRQISVKTDEENGTMTIKLFLDPAATLWGYHVSYQGGNLVLECTTPAQIKDGEKPLSNLSIVIDPGHGGVDVGAWGVMGKKGASEKELALAYAQALRHRLELLGARVYMTRADDTVMAEEDRILYSDYKEADFFISFHFNSTSADRDPWEESGFQVFCNYELSRDFGYLLYRNLVRQLRVEPKGFSSNNLSIVQVPLARSVIIVPGNVTSPQDYGRITDPVEIYKTSWLISDSILQYLQHVTK